MQRKCISMKRLYIRKLIEKSLFSLLNSPATIAGSLKLKSFSKESKTRWFSSNPNELCDRLKL